ncbi:hypothetical protein APSETT445_004247 [Aspergillus pseudonomiae]
MGFLYDTMEANGIPRAFVRGPTEPPIYSKTFGQLLDEQAAIHDKRPAILSPWQGINLSYDELAQRSKHVSKALLGMGLAYGDCVGIMAGNSCQHIEVLMGGARIGCPVVSLHSTYTPEELKRAVRKTTCKLLFIASHIGRRDLSAHVEMAKDWLSSGALPNLRGVLTIGQSDYDGYVQGLHTYETLFSEYKEGVTAPDVDATFLLDLAEKAVTPDDVVRFEFTSGLLASLTHGSAIVLPSDHFSAHAVLEAIKKQAPTVLLGVPTMFVAELDAMAKGQADTSLRAAVVGGSPMPSALTKNICDLMKIKEVHVVYGMMEAGVMFMGSFNGLEESTGMVGHVMPHVSAKVLNRSGEVASRGEKGELYTSGYSLQKGYFDDEEKTAEAMTRDKDGHIWMRTGDEAIIDENGCCYITGRIKDIIIRVGGENISPWEVESRLASHPSISEASVFGLPDTKYGEVVGCFLKCALDSERLSNEEVQGWVRKTLGWHKTPVHIFWIGDPGVADEFPRTGSGKHQKHVMKNIGKRLIAAKSTVLCDRRSICELWT